MFLFFQKVKLKMLCVFCRRHLDMGVHSTLTKNHNKKLLISFDLTGFFLKNSVGSPSHLKTVTSATGFLVVSGSGSCLKLASDRCAGSLGGGLSYTFIFHNASGEFSLGFGHRGSCTAIHLVDL